MEQGSKVRFTQGADLSEAHPTWREFGAVFTVVERDGRDFILRDRAGEMGGADVDEIEAATCRYCDQPVHEFEDGQPNLLCDFHTDWECACNLSEDEFNGSTFGWYVEQKMAEWGWTPEQIKARLAKETV